MNKTNRVKCSILFLLGEKGLNVLSAIVQNDWRESVELVVVGEDQNINNDFSEEIIGLCLENNIAHCSEEEFRKLQISHQNFTAWAAGWRRMIKCPFKQTIVLHDSLLPRLRGFNPLVTALLNKEKEIGASVIIAKSTFDSGDIIANDKILIEYPIKIQQAIDKICQIYYSLTKSVYSSFLLNGVLKGTPQDENNASYSVWRDNEDYKIDWNLPAQEILHFIDCVSSPYKGASTLINNQVVRIFGGKAIDDINVENRVCGKVIFIDNGFPIVICGKGLLKVTKATYEDSTSLFPVKQLRTRFG